MRAESQIEDNHFMLKKTGIALICATFLAGCTTDPYTGQQKYPIRRAARPSARLSVRLGGLMVGGSSRAQRNAVLIGAGIGALGGGLDR